jgi:hypothetical protein
MMLALPSVVMASRHLEIPFRICNFKCQLIGSIGMLHRQFLFIPVIYIRSKAMPLCCLLVLFRRVAMKLVHAPFPARIGPTYLWAKFTLSDLHSLTNQGQLTKFRHPPKS